MPDPVQDTAAADVAAGAADSAAQTAEAAAEPAVDTVETAAQPAAEATAPAAQAAAEPAAQVTEPAAESAEAAAQTAETAAAPAVETVETAAQPAAEATAPAAETAEAAVAESAAQTAEMSSQTVAQTAETISEPLVEHSGAVSETIEAAGEPVTQAAEPTNAAVDTVADPVSEVAGAGSILPPPGSPPGGPPAGLPGWDAPPQPEALVPVPAQPPVLEELGGATETIPNVLEPVTSTVQSAPSGSGMLVGAIDPPMPTGGNEHLLDPVSFDVTPQFGEAPVPGATIDPVPLSEGLGGVVTATPPATDAVVEPGVSFPSPQSPYSEASGQLPTPPPADASAADPISTGTGFLEGVGQALELSGSGLAYGGIAATVALLGAAAATRSAVVMSAFAGCYSPGVLAAVPSNGLGTPPQSGTSAADDTSGANGANSEAGGVKGTVAGEASDIPESPESAEAQGPVEVGSGGRVRIPEVVHFTLLALSLALLAAAALPKRVLRRAAVANGVRVPDPRPYLVAVGVSVLLALHLVLLAT
jgi:hypothetical protein